MINNQHCLLCGCETGGEGDDQILAELLPGAVIGPLCKNCYNEWSPVREIEKLLDKLARAEAELSEYRALGREVSQKARDCAVSSSAVSLYQHECYYWIAGRIRDIISMYHKDKNED